MMLSNSQVRAISASVSHLPNLTGLCVDNTNLNDTNLAILLRTIVQHIPCFRSIMIRGSSIQLGERSIKQLTALIRRPIPNQLRKLEIRNAMIKSVDVEGLIDAITGNPSFLQTLCLSQITLQLAQVMQLSKYINENLQLTDLSLNELHLSAMTFTHILQAIAKNRKLKSLSL